MDELEEEQSHNVMEILLQNDQLSHELSDPDKTEGDPQLSLITLAKEDSLSGGDEPEDSKLHIAGITDAIQPQDSVIQPVMQVLPGNHNQTLTLADGQILQTITLPNGDGKLETIHLEDGSTAIVQSSPPKGILEGQVIQLEDGSTGFIQTGPPDGLQAIQLEDGTTAYLQTNLLGDATTVSISLDQLQHQVVGVEPNTIPVPSSSMVMPATQLHPISSNADGSDIPASIISSAEILSSMAGGVPVTAEGLHAATTPSAAASSSSMSVNVVSRLPSEKALALGDKAFRCGYIGCGRLYTTQHHLKVHERSHTGDRPFRCDFRGCGKAFATGYGLKSHVRVHTGEKPYRCPEELCTKAFKTSGDLQKHVRIHTGERPFKCPFEGCERSFTTSNIRKVHIRTHTGERPYICVEDGCNKSFASATNYKNHIRIHTGEKPYVCTVHGCGKRFTEYSSLYKHHVVHTHSKPYICDHCGKTYRQTSTLAIHKRTVHGEDVGVDVDGNLISAVVATGILGEDELKKAIPEMAATLEESDGTLIINTSDSQQSSTISKEGDLAGSTVDVLSSLAGVQQLMPTSAIPQVYFVTNPAHVQALRDQLSQQQQQQQVLSGSGSGVLTLEEVAPVSASNPQTESQPGAGEPMTL